jgi:hypothetical protein
MSVNSYPFFLCLRTETLAARGDTAAVLETVTGALETARRTGYVEYEAQLVGLRGELLLGVEPSPTSDSASDAEAAFVEALAIVRRHQVRSLELRAATSQARLWRSHGQRQQAHDLLSR